MKLQNGLLLICLYGAMGAAAQGSAHAVFDKATVETGDTFVLRVMVSGINAEPGKVDFSAWKELLPAENVLSRSGWSRVGGRWVSQYTLIAFDSASLILPPLRIPQRAGDSLRSNPLELQVKPTYATAEVDDAENIRDIQREPASWMDQWPWALGAVLLLALLWWRLRRKKPKPVAVFEPTATVQPAIPPHQVALQKLTQLEQKQLWKKGNVEPFYAELSLIVREYLEGRFKIPALESTTREILPLLKTAGFPDNLNGVLREILHESDMTKYAQHPPPEQFHAKALDMTRQLVMATAV